MLCQAYVKGDRLFVNFNKMSIVYDELNFQLGDAATNFAAFPRNAFRAILNKFQDAFLKLVVKNTLLCVDGATLSIVKDGSGANRNPVTSSVLRAPIETARLTIPMTGSPRRA